MESLELETPQMDPPRPSDHERPELSGQRDEDDGDAPGHQRTTSIFFYIFCGTRV